MFLHFTILIFSLLLSTLIPQLGEAATKAAVIVGISDYSEESGIPDLQFAARDAQNFSDFLKEHGYQCYTLIDGTATKENLKGGIDAFARNAMQEPLEQVIFYFSGRGTRAPDERMPPDEDDGLDECLLLGDAKAEAIGTYLLDDELLRLLARIRTNVALIILDCSFGGAPENVAIKGFGSALARELDGVNLMKEGDVGSLQNALVLSASKPEEGAVDGVLMPALLTALETEGTDTTGDRRLSVVEIHQSLKAALEGKQTPQLFDLWQLNPTLVELPPLPTLQISSVPSSAEVFITSNQEERKRVGQTPLQLKLKRGAYRVEVEKAGFRRPPAQTIELAEYDKAYTLEPFTLHPIGVHGTVLDAKGNPIGNLTAQFQQSGKIVDQRQIGNDGIFHLSPEQDNWLQREGEYSITVTGSKVLTPGVASFTFTGYEDIPVSVSVVLDTTPPELIRVDFSSSRTVPAPNRLIPGDEVTITITARDDGFGVESAALFLRRSETDELLPLKPSEIQDQDRVYAFRYSIPETPSAIEEWSVAQIELTDKGENSCLYRGDETHINFTVFPDALAMGESYFKEKAYAKSLAAFGLAEVQTDRSRYLTALAHYELKSTQKAVETFLTITEQHTYLGKNRPSALPPVPRPFLNKLWGRYLDGLPQNRQNPDYLELLAVTAEALNRPEDAKLYRGYRERVLRK